MPDPRFYSVTGPLALGDLAELAEADLAGAAEPGRMFRDVAPLQAAGPDDVSFFDGNRVYRDAFAGTAAGACIVSPQAAEDRTDIALLVVADVHRAQALVAQAFYPEADNRNEATAPGVDPTAALGRDVTVGPGAVIGAGAEIGAQSRIAANAVIGPSVKLGEGCVIGPGASLRYCIAGDRLRVAAGTRIGEDGFGYAMGAGSHLRVPQLGRVMIGDGVEIGANATIDRGSGPDTVIGDGVIIDNLVQVAHNVRIGRGCVIVAQVGISGSTTIGENVLIGGQAGITGHLTIGDGVQIAAQSGVMNDLPAGAIVGGTPAQLQRDYWKQLAILRRLAKKGSEDR